MLICNYNASDFTKVALAYGIDSFSINKFKKIETGLAKLWEDTSKPFLLEVSIDVHTNVFPKMMFGNPIPQMEPEINSLITT